MKDLRQEFDQAAEELRNAWRVFTAPAVAAMGAWKRRIINVLDMLRREAKK